MCPSSRSDGAAPALRRVCGSQRHWTGHRSGGAPVRRPGTWDRHRCREGNYRGDVELSSLIDTLSSHPGPVLTWYGKDRTELGGPVAARWLAKTANLLGGDLSGDLFGQVDAAPSPGPGSTIRVDLGCSWQDVIWTSTAWLSGWNLVSEGVPDVWVVASVGDATDALAQGTPWVLVQAMGPLAMSWSGALPDGALDALAELAAQPDALVVTPRDPSPSHDLPDGPGMRRSTGNGREMLLVSEAHADVTTVLAMWEKGVGVVAVDTSVHDRADQMRIGDAERAACPRR